MLKLVQHVYVIPVLISALLSLKALRNKWPIQYRLFSILLLLVLFTEAAAISWKYYFHNIGSWHYLQNNLWVYNIFIIPQYLLYMAVFYFTIRSSTTRKLIPFLAFVFVTVAVSDIFYFHSIYAINSVTVVAADVIVTFLSIIYFEQLRKDKEITKLTEHPMTWISLGAFLFHIANMPFMLTLNYLNETNQTLAATLYYIHLFLNFSMYSLYSIAFLCRHSPITRHP